MFRPQCSLLRVFFPSRSILLSAFFFLHPPPPLRPPLFYSRSLASVAANIMEIPERDGVTIERRDAYLYRAARREFQLIALLVSSRDAI